MCARAFPRHGRSSTARPISWRRIKADFAYEIGATTVTTTPSTAYALRRGVCQDFAHIMISGLRGIGLPAAYVSGYLRTVPKEGRARLEGADAMHAWVMVWCGEAAAQAVTVFTVGVEPRAPKPWLRASGRGHATTRPTCQLPATGGS